MKLSSLEFTVFDKYLKEVNTTFKGESYSQIQQIEKKKKEEDLLSQNNFLGFFNRSLIKM